MKDVFVITCDRDNNESYPEDRLGCKSIVGVFETFDDAQNAFDNILKQCQEYVDRVNTEIDDDDFKLKIINVVRKPGYMYFAVENDGLCDMYSNNTYAIIKFTLGEIEKYCE